MSRPRQPEQTRALLLDAAFREIRRTGYQAASLDRILDGTGITRGALYHHFADKQALGHAVVDERIRPWIRERWIDPLLQAEDPLVGLEASVEGVLAASTNEDLALGCPFNNLIQEMAPLDDGFRTRLRAILEDWQAAVAIHLALGQAAGRVRSGIDPDATAVFLIAAFEGLFGITKTTASRSLASAMIDILLDFIDGLRPDTV